MPDPLDTLRNDIAKTTASAYQRWDMHEYGHDTWAEFIANEVMRVLAAASGEQRRALLGILGYSVETYWRDPNFPADLYVRDVPVDPSHEQVQVLRDQRETTEVMEAVETLIRKGVVTAEQFDALANPEAPDA